MDPIIIILLLLLYLVLSFRDLNESTLALYVLSDMQYKDVTYRAVVRLLSVFSFIPPTS